MPADALLALQTSTTVTATGTSAGLSIRKPASTSGTNRGGTPRRGLRVRIIVTAVSGTTPTAAFKLQVSDDNSAYADSNVLVNGSANTINAAGEYFMDLNSEKGWVRLAYTITGTTPSFTFSAEIVASRP